jgi:hypothetical protein
MYMSNNWLRLMDNWYGLLVVIYVKHWRVILYIDVNPWRKSGSKKDWVMKPKLFHV